MTKDLKDFCSPVQKEVQSDCIAPDLLVGASIFACYSHRFSLDLSGEMAVLETDPPKSDVTGLL